MGFEVTDVRVEIFPERLNAVVNDPNGSVSTSVAFIANALLRAAQPLIGQRFLGHHPGPRLRPRRRHRAYIGQVSYRADETGAAGFALEGQVWNRVLSLNFSGVKMRMSHKAIVSG